MDQRTAIERDTLISYFPNLEADGDFVITSPSTYDYNCIAWALGYNNKWLWPLDEDCDILDGVEYWPDGLPRTEDIGNIIEASLNDITHGTPFSIEGDMYGKVHCIMKRPEKY